MARYPLIPGIPFVASGGLIGLTRASAFVTMPRGPVQFHKTTVSRPPPPLPRPASLLPAIPGAPRRVAFRDACVSAIPFPALVRPAPCPPSPPASPLRYTVWCSPSVSKTGVRRAFINRRLPPFSPPPSRIPLPLPRPQRLLPAAPRKYGFVASPIPSFDAALAEPALPSPCKRSVPPTRAVGIPATCRKVHFAQDASPATLARGDDARRSASSLRSILVRSRPDKVRAKKSVRFGDAVSHDVDYWIDRKKHVFNDGGLWMMGRLQGWRVTPLDTPDADGETEKYMTMWGHDHSSLHYHTKMPPCKHGCSWGSIVKLASAYHLSGVYLWNDHDVLLRAWSETREWKRERGWWCL
ncbi:hypothetical protein BGW36DRAFT_369160 [Talaromyces proteolyticus]|uniref:Uncharacterized protein n=1 Tax=Talaromyces proteolyticus TaxID=1131652 RepID=A0AAD4Q4S9_9EURO|nr:uncharacterized protein BGW36DRAFT_369160 [Talaromyces proteolyticus]KAH8703325.1 hypothetical protein BGW36DRAFT_369160 [Talaromyces proteolyticus]